MPLPLPMPVPELFISCRCAHLITHKGIVLSSVEAVKLKGRRDRYRSVDLNFNTGIGHGIGIGHGGL